MNMRIMLSPSNSQALQWYAINLAISRDLSGAIEQLEKAKEIDPLSSQIGVLLGGFYAYRDDDEHALKSWEDVLRFDPDNVPVYLNKDSSSLGKNRKSLHWRT